MSTYTKFYMNDEGRMGMEVVTEILKKYPLGTNLENMENIKTEIKTKGYSYQPFLTFTEEQAIVMLSLGM